MYRTRIGTTTPDLSGPVSNANKALLYTLQTIRCSLVLYPVNPLFESYSFARDTLSNADRASKNSDL